MIIYCVINIRASIVDKISDQSNGDCDFENGNLCQWNDDILADFKWTINSGPTLSSGNF